MPFLHERLANGLDVVAETSDAAVSTSIGFFVATGSRDENDDVSGVSHFLEHMVFKGTPGISGDEINHRFDAMGASANAFTSEEDTVYYASVLPEQQHEAVELLAAMMRPALRDADFDTEKLVILEEIRMYDDQPPFGADDRCRASYFGRHPLARSVLGTVESITRLPVEAMRDYHRRCYAPGNTVLAASGAIDFPALVESAQRLCGDWEPAAPLERRLPHPPRQAAHPGVERIVKASAALDYAVWMVAGPDEFHADRHAARLLAMLLGDASGSRLYWGLIDTGEAEQAACLHQDYLDAGLFVTQLSCDAADVETLRERIAAIYATAATEGLERAEFERARNKLASRVVLGGEKPRRRLFEVGLDWSHARTYRSVSDQLRLVEAVTLDDAHRVLNAWPLDAPAAVVIAGPDEVG
ncbi:MAG: insulinase family protein [Planctomycetes bacterium]|nr:insulinase family protein [Planctomycetota bacterium]